MGVSCIPLQPFTSLVSVKVSGSTLGDIVGGDFFRFASPYSALIAADRALKIESASRAPKTSVKSSTVSSRPSLGISSCG